MATSLGIDLLKADPMEVILAESQTTFQLSKHVTNKVFSMPAGTMVIPFTTPVFHGLELECNEQRPAYLAQG
jgi:hypothetical protein